YNPLCFNLALPPPFYAVYRLPAADGYNISVVAPNRVITSFVIPITDFNYKVINYSYGNLPERDNVSIFISPILSDRTWHVVCKKLSITGNIYSSG
ncbi:hypothetical protein J6590_005782, partial [Homalodisca vitripennis]